MEQGQCVDRRFLHALAKLFGVPPEDLIFNPIRYYLNPDVLDDDGEPVRSRLNLICDERFRSEGEYGFHPAKTFVPVLAQSEGQDKAQDWVEFSVSQLSSRRILDSAQKHRLLLGNYGQGKTYCSWRLALQLAKQFPARPQPDSAPPPSAGQVVKLPPVPLIFPLRELNPQSAVPPWDQVCQYFRARLPELEFDGWLRCTDLNMEYDVLLVLDALDEVPATVTKALSKLQELCRNLNKYPNLFVIVTARSGMLPGGSNEIKDLFPGFTAVSRLSPWGAESWETLLRMCEAAKPDLFPNGWTRFRDALNERPTRDLTTRPLWCRLIIECRDEIFKYTIEDESSLYALYIDRFFRESDEARDAVEYLSKNQKLRILEILGAELARKVSGARITEDDLRRITVNECHTLGESALNKFLRGELRTHSLLHCDEMFQLPGCAYHFGHSSFEEYFQASFFVSFIKSVAHSQLSPATLSMLADVSRLITTKASIRRFAVGLLRHCSTNLSALLCEEPESVFGHASDPSDEVREALLICWLETSRNLLHIGYPNLSGFRLAGLTLKHLDLSNCLLRSTDLAGAKLVGGTLENADLRGANCCGTTFVNVSFNSMVNLDGANLRGAAGLPRGLGRRPLRQ